ncbi:MAG: antibiotic biosynthesis monooxygenase, partial [Proteobacteria bacterium]|nr:antibiotic biosynthesis monooxygenase [Pseudomonadota bacterium]MBU1585778.1 antibiotic biosynthesis monooxygenase [Pseudomonadota bacterium]
KRDVIEGREKEFYAQLKNLRFYAMDQKGYISGETLICAENTNKVMVISNWETMEDWSNWKTNANRMEIDDKLKELQENPTVYEPYVFSKYKAAAEQGFPLPLQKQRP